MVVLSILSFPFTSISLISISFSCAKAIEGKVAQMKRRRKKGLKYVVKGTAFLQTQNLYMLSFWRIIVNINRRPEISGNRRTEPRLTLRWRGGLGPKCSAIRRMGLVLAKGYDDQVNASGGSINHCERGCAQGGIYLFFRSFSFGALPFLVDTGSALNFFL